jgi:CubicO group peptidase (beta-lactamase class C family)
MTQATYPSSDSGLGEFEYTNLGYNLMSIWLERHYGEDWRHSLRDLLLDPLALERSTGFMSLAQSNGWDVARPYDYRLGAGREAVYLQKTDSTMHAVGLVSPTREAARFLMVHLNEGVLGGEQLLPANVIEQSQVKQVATEGPFFDGYAWGWFTKEYEGRNAVFHTGGFVGASALLAMIPDEEIGVIVLQNESGLRANMVSSFVEELVYEKLLGTGHPDAGSPAISEQILSMSEFLASAKKRNWDRARALAERPSKLSAPLPTYEGSYVHPLSGIITVATHGNSLLFTWGNLRGVAYPGEDRDTVEVRFRPGNLEPVMFEIEGGEVTGLISRGFRFGRE